jgi:hypothetical protein
LIVGISVKSFCPTGLFKANGARNIAKGLLNATTILLPYKLRIYGGLAAWQGQTGFEGASDATLALAFL